MKAHTKASPDRTSYPVKAFQLMRCACACTSADPNHSLNCCSPSTRLLSVSLIRPSLLQSSHSSNPLNVYAFFDYERRILSEYQVDDDI